MARAIAAAVCAGALLVGLSGCSLTLGLPTSGVVERVPRSHKEGHRVYIDPQGPQRDAEPEQLVRGFIAALPAGPQTDGFKVARQFLTDKAAGSWKPDSTVSLYSGDTNIGIGAQGVDGSASAQGKTLVNVSFNSIGQVDAHGVFSAEQSGHAQNRQFGLVREDGQWRIDSLPDGIIIASSDFQQVYRQVQLYQLAVSDRTLVPDTRWFGWRQWRTLAVRELLAGAAPWLSGAVRSISAGKVSLAVDSVPSSGGRVEVRLSNAAALLSDDDRSMLIHQIRLTLGDGNADYDLHVVDNSGRDLSNIDAHTDLAIEQDTRHLYTVSNKAVVSIPSQNLIRLGETDAGLGARGLAFTAQGGAILDAGMRVDCLTAAIADCGTMFAGATADAIAAGIDGEVWMADYAQPRLGVGERGRYVMLDAPWLQGRRITAFAVSPEGSRVAVALAGDATHGASVVMAGVERDDDGRAVGLGDTTAVLSHADEVSALAFYNDTTVVYAVGASVGGYQQLAPGPEAVQPLPRGTVALASAQIDQSLSLISLDDAGYVRYARGALTASWRVLDLQTTAISSGR